MPANATTPDRKGPHPVENRDSNVCVGGNLRCLVGWRLWLPRLGAAVFSGVLLSAAFPPLEWSLAAWFALVPVLLIPAPRPMRERALIGYVFGYAHFATCLHWLNEVGFGAGYLLSVYCALYPMLWYVLTTEAMTWLSTSRSEANATHVSVPAGRAEIALVLVGAVCWVGLEWLRGWLFTGFPWNAIGISQWLHVPLLALTAFTGVAGVSFLIVSVNLGLLTLTLKWWSGMAVRRRAHRLSWGLGAAAMLMLVAAGIIAAAPRVPDTPAGYLRVLAVQGNIPQWRFWTEEQFEEALSVYTGLTRLTEPVVRADLVVWPESAVPAPLDYPPYEQALKRLFADIDTPVLMGALVSRRLPDARWTEDGWDPPPLDFNSAVLFSTAGEIVDRYDKVHLVPFGEFVPMRQYLPWLVDLIGMGRDLTPGQEFTILELAHDTRAGVNICFEDVFPEISRQFVRRGANLLMTLTNDAWYAESAGSRQHMIHSVFRAAETRRPLLRSGNNSDTCLIMPDGRVTGLLYDAVGSGSRFVRGTDVYDVPIHEDLPITVYTRAGDWFAIINALAMIVFVALAAGRHLSLRRQRYDVITGSKDTVS